ncbi:39S ribosomal protein L54, mitochondrial [Chrysoperla carnea]|uniref:39S ribosomal protein L54, mitochondrial n=1 Tax=Chrysoperla carnea TaxID=189513 RepID=UPI001D086043|nr:39S ribosomal protein L54, mitochondrial [Chrysoperla carnea]
MLFLRNSLLQTTRVLMIATNNYSKPAIASMGAKGKKKLGKLGPMVEKKVLPVETDPNKLVNFVCGSNIFKEGKDIELKPDSEYPEWLWKLNIGKPLTLDELDPETKQYWRKLRKMGLKRNNQLAKVKKLR